MAQSLFLKTKNNIQKVFSRYFPKPLDIALIPQTSKDGGYIFKITVIIEGTTAKLTDEERNSLYLSSQKAYDMGPRWILMDLTKNVYYRGISMSSGWLKTIVPNILKSGMTIIDDFLCTLISEELNFQLDELGEKYLNVLDELRNLYIIGSIITNDKDFIRRWELVNIKYDNIYHPSWENTLLTGEDVTNFLLGASKKSSYEEAKRDLWLSYSKGNYNNI
jgi:hypothetical protein